MRADESPATRSTAIINELFGTGAAGILLPISDHSSSLSDSEYDLVRNSSQKRRLEFSTGRMCAKSVLAGLGIANFSILRNAQREPIWPDGFVGSISHCRDVCGAVAAKKSDFKSIGFDIENIREIKQDITEYVCTAQERDWLAQQTSHPHQLLVILLFSLKESVFKCVSPYQNIQPGFKDCSLTPALTACSADIHFHRSDIEPDITLRFSMTAQHVYSGAYYK